MGEIAETEVNERKALQRLETAHGFCAQIANNMPVNPLEISPTHRMANAWVLVVTIYSGLEQALKNAAVKGGTSRERVRKAKHDLGQIWQMTPEDCRRKCDSYYGEWISAMTAGDPGTCPFPSTAGEFVLGISNGYGRWRYWLNEPENDKDIPPLHDGPMLEIWLAVNDWLNEKGPRETAIVRGPLLRSIRAAIDNAWEDMCDEMEHGAAEGRVPACWQWPRPEYTQAAEILWRTQSNRGPNPAWNSEVWEIYQAWAVQMRKPLKQRGPYDCVHTEVINAWVRRAGTIKLTWMEDERKWSAAGQR